MNPDHDSGLFVYHLSQMVDLGVVERADGEYVLTDFGERIGELVSAVERESAFLIDRTRTEDKEVKEMSGDINVQWLGLDAMFQRGLLYNTEEDFVPKMSEEQRKAYETSKRWPRVEQYLLALKEDRPLAHIKVGLRYQISAEVEKEILRSVKSVKSMEPQVHVEDMGLRTTEAIERNKAVTVLLKTLEDEGRKVGIKRIWVYQINAEDKAVVSALKEKGFQRFATTYIMTKEI